MCLSSSPDSAVVPVEVDVLNRAEVLPVLDELDGGAVAQQVEPEISNLQLNLPSINQLLVF